MSIGDGGQPLAPPEVNNHDLDVETGDVNGSANASRSLVASGYMVSSGNSHPQQGLCSHPVS